MLLAGDEDFTAPNFRERLKRHMSGLDAGAGAPELGRGFAGFARGAHEAAGRSTG